MGKIDSFLEKIGIKDTEVDEVLLDTLEEDVDRPVAPKAKPAEPVSYSSPRRSLHDRKVINMGSDSVSIREGGGAAAMANAMMKVVVINPKNIDDCQQIANCLKEKRPVVINLENVEEPTAVRIIDFISGTIYAIDGAVNKISRNVWLFAPKNVNIAVSQQSHGLGNMPWEPNNNK
ncbi:cell division protein SepF [Anaerovibrio sp. RM50]|uniref:cell division protein SepF n=1 Tax=Anaerovibrio sp. RM50 TaxID=1200557 RepID=UPI000484A0C8|nr:cell division protein SepF [Anaerovibrio sp. RM50]